MKKLIFTLLCAALIFGATAEDAIKERNRKQNLAQLSLPVGCWSKAQVIAARPTDTTVDLNILASNDVVGTLLCNGKTIALKLQGGVPTVIRLDQLAPDREYRYSMTLDGEKSPEYSFHTQRKVGSSFTFAIQGDSHPERGHQNNADVYAKTLSRVAAEKVDFYFCLGDDFSIDQMRKTPSKQEVDSIYRTHRPWLSLVNAPLFLVNGNHEQAAKCNLDGTPDNVAVWAQNAREKYYSQPAPEGIYSGDMKKVDHIGFLRDYYAWHWGDALFVVIDPYWHSDQAVDNKFGTREKNKDPWLATLGDEQYQWLKQTLESSKAKYKFIFTHHVNGTGRGGVEAAKLYEWGGLDRKGRSLFRQKRPNWEMPIHDLLVKYKVSAIFQGHDHVFAHQELDGVVYQTLPLPGGSPESLENAAAYQSGKVLPGSGFLRVQVSPETCTVDFMKNGEAKPVYSYQIKPKQED